MEEMGLEKSSSVRHYKKKHSKSEEREGETSVKLARSCPEEVDSMLSSSSSSLPAIPLLPFPHPLPLKYHSNSTKRNNKYDNDNAG